MASYDIFVDVAGNGVVSGIGNSTPAPLPPFVQGDTPALNIWLLNRTVTYPTINPFVSIPTAGLSLEVALGTRIGSSSFYYAQQFTWVPDGTGLAKWSAPFALNTDAVTTLLGSNSQAQAWFEVKYLSGGLPTTVLDKSVLVQAAVIKPGVLVVPAGQTAISAEEVNQAFLRKENYGFILTNANTGKKAYVYLADDGTFKVDPLN